MDAHVTQLNPRKLQALRRSDSDAEKIAVLIDPTLSRFNRYLHPREIISQLRKRQEFKFSTNRSAMSAIYEAFASIFLIQSATNYLHWQYYCSIEQHPLHLFGLGRILYLAIWLGGSFLIAAFAANLLPVYELPEAYIRAANNPSELFEAVKAGKNYTWFLLGDGLAVEKIKVCQTAFDIAGNDQALEDSELLRMLEYALAHWPNEVYVSSLDEAVNRLLSSNTYIFIGETIEIRYLSMVICDLYTVS
ncbi:unnamed protein product [Protopolystoma xenopodis]|uniref:Uncharacterized protein n=1 Tax=Protopolystoma xenopodis TaxID=117903 RepID=A0A448XJ09_9PLAT|nr:unnamed protein product [Protopolystoma xenopodis]